MASRPLLKRRRALGPSGGKQRIAPLICATPNHSAAAGSANRFLGMLMAALNLAVTEEKAPGGPWSFVSRRERGPKPITLPEGRRVQAVDERLRPRLPRTGSRALVNRLPLSGSGTASRRGLQHRCWHDAHSAIEDRQGTRFDHARCRCTASALAMTMSGVPFITASEA